MLASIAVSRAPAAGLVLVAIALGGCGDPLRSFSRGELVVERESDSISVFLSTDDGCRSIATGTRGTVNGVALRIVDRGGDYAVDRSSRCTRAHLRATGLKPAADEPLRVELTDGKHTISARLGKAGEGATRCVGVAACSVARSFE